MKTDQAVEMFCQTCGGPIRGTYPIVCPQCGAKTRLPIYPVGVALVQVKAEHRSGILVIRRAIRPSQGQWALIGGFANPGETAIAAAAREVKEEIGLTLTVEDLGYWGEAPATDGDRLLLFYLSRPMSPNELSDYRLDPAEVDDLRVAYAPEELAFSTHTDMLQAYFASIS